MREMLDSDQRLVVLRTLDDNGGSANESILQLTLGSLGHNISTDAIRTHIHWLEEQGLVRHESVLGLYVASLTIRGQDVALGRAVVPGVRKPRPRG